MHPYESGPRRSGLRALFLILLLLAVSLLLVLNGCSSAQGAVSRQTLAAAKDAADSTLLAAEAFTDQEVVAAVRMLENQPLDSAAPVLRRRLFAWLIVSPRLGDFTSDTPPIDELQQSRFPYKEELMMQYLFGSAALVAAANDELPDLLSQQEAGLRSMIVAYRNIVQREPSARDPFIDDLDGMRRRGELREYLKEVNQRGARR